MTSARRASDNGTSWAASSPEQAELARTTDRFFAGLHKLDGPLTTELRMMADDLVGAGMPRPLARRHLSAIMSVDDPGPELRALFASSLGQHLLPSVAALDMDQGGRNLHKDTLAHSITVAAQCPRRLRARWAGLLHDVGKAPTRRINGARVTFYGHEAIGQGIARSTMLSLGYGEAFASQVAKLVGISGRTHNFDGTWTDSAIRRFITDAGELVEDVLDLSRADCTSKRPGRRDQVLAQVGAVAARIDAVLALDKRRSLRPALDGEEIMDLLNLAPGPAVGRAYKHLLEEARAGRQLGKDEARELLVDWWAEAGAEASTAARD